jgi:sugar O-acyltransferase (sialic acid O-acetyltransferase NeuD family)
VNEEIIVIGGGGHAKVVLSTLIDLRMRVQGVYDDDPQKWGKECFGAKIVGSISGLDPLLEGNAIMAIGDNKIRHTVAKRFLKLHWASLIHPYAFVHPSASIGEGSVVFAGAVIQADVVSGGHCIVNSNATIDHDCVLGDYSHIGPGVCLAGGVSVGEGAFFGIGAVAIIGRDVGKWSIIGAGGVITVDIPDYVTAVGVPARVVKRHDEPTRPDVAMKSILV